MNGDEQTFARISDVHGHVFNAGSENEVTATVLSLSSGGRLSGIVKFSGILESLYIGGEALTIDGVCGTQQPAPIFIDSWIVSVEESSPGLITYVWDIEALNVDESDFRIVRSNNLISPFANYSGNAPTVLSHGLGTDLYRISKTEPADLTQRFYRVRLSHF